MFDEQLSAEMELFDLEDLAEPKNRVKMCYAFLQSERFFYQELSILNPNPTQFKPGYVFPADLYLYILQNDGEKELLPLDELLEIAEAAEVPIVCIGSHREEEDRTIQLISLPQSMATSDLLPQELILVRFLVPVSEEEKRSIMDELTEKYFEICKAGGV